MKKGYQILEIGWQYNDETYSKGGRSTFVPSNKIYNDIEKAKAALQKKEIEAYRNAEFIMYIGADNLESYTAKGVTEQDVLDYVKEVFKIEFEDNEYFDLIIPDNATDKQVEGLMKLLKLKFYELQEVNID